jgi:hypothetical protein
VFDRNTVSRRAGAVLRAAAMLLAGAALAGTMQAALAQALAKAPPPASSLYTLDCDPL